MSYLFDPDLNLYLQSFGNVWLTGVMLVVSAMGSKSILVLLALLILTAIDFKKGTVILQLVLVSFVLTGLLKELFGHPRPTEVELSLSEFAELLPYWIMDYVRPDDSPDFPSGHVLSTVVFWTSVAYLFPGKIQKTLATILIVLMPISRIYLGRHYPGDVLGGLLIGAFIPVLSIFLLNRFKLGSWFLNQENRPKVNINLAIFLFMYLVILPIVLNLIPFLGSEETGLWFGFNFFCLWMILRRLPMVDDHIPTSWLHLLLLISVYVGVEQILSMIEFPSGNKWIEFTAAAAPLLLSLFITDFVQRLRIYNVLRR